MNTITANQLKTKGVSAIQKNLSENCELVITVRGKEKYGSSRISVANT